MSFPSPNSATDVVLRSLDVPKTALLVPVVRRPSSQDRGALLSARGWRFPSCASGERRRAHSEQLGAVRTRWSQLLLAVLGVSCLANHGCAIPTAMVEERDAAIADAAMASRTPDTATPPNEPQGPNDAGLLAAAAPETHDKPIEADDGDSDVAPMPPADAGIGPDSVASPLAPDPAQAPGVQRLTPEGTGDASGFGDSLAMGENLLVVGAPGEVGEKQPDAVYLYDWQDGAWQPSGKLLPSSSTTGLGRSLAVDEGGQRVLVGSEGSAFLFARDPAKPGAWLQLHQFRKPTDDATGFGKSVGIHGDTAAIASEDEVWLFVETEESSWSADPVQLTAPAQGGSEGRPRFGQALALGDDRLLVGAPTSTLTSTDADPSGTSLEHAGAAYVYQRTASDRQWSTVPTALVLSGAMPTPYDNFGAAVAIVGEWLAVAAPGRDGVDGSGTGEPNRGAVYLFTLADTPLHETTLRPSPDGVGFGVRMAASGSHLYVASMLRDPGTNTNDILELRTDLLISRHDLAATDPTQAADLWASGVPNPGNGAHPKAIAAHATQVAIGAPQANAGTGETYVRVPLAAAP